MSVSTFGSASATASKQLRSFGAVALANNTRFGLKTNPAIQSEIARVSPNPSASKLLSERQRSFKGQSENIIGDGSNANDYLAQAIQKRDEMVRVQQQEQALAGAVQASQTQQQQFGGGGQSGGGVQLSTGGYNGPMGPNVKTSNVRQGIISTAKKYLGTPYVWGGKTPKGFDCSGLTSYVYRQYGIKLPAWSNHQTKTGVRSNISNARPGDLVGWNRGGHVGIYIGNGMLLHSPRPGRSVEIRPLRANEGAYAVRLSLPGD